MSTVNCTRSSKRKCERPADISTTGLRGAALVDSESISRLAGSYHGTKLDPAELIAAAHRASRPAAERSTLYEIRRRHELRIAA